MGNRRRARELALQVLFHLEFNKDDPGWERQFWKNNPVPHPTREFTEELFKGVIENQATIDEYIIKHAQHWALDRMTVIDRNILRIAVFEMTIVDTVPVKVAMNEAIEIAKRYGDEASGAFVNGILDHIIKAKEALIKK